MVYWHIWTSVCSYGDTSIYLLLVLNMLFLFFIHLFKWFNNHQPQIDSGWCPCGHPRFICSMDRTRRRHLQVAASKLSGRPREVGERLKNNVVGLTFQVIFGWLSHKNYGFVGFFFGWWFARWLDFAHPKQDTGCTNAFEECLLLWMVSSTFQFAQMSGWFTQD